MDLSYYKRYTLTLYEQVHLEFVNYVEYSNALCVTRTFKY
jgi:hypothetical protein